MATLISTINGMGLKAVRAEKDNLGHVIDQTYAPQATTYTKSEVDSLVGGIVQFHYEIVATKPAVGLGNVLYLVGPIGTGSDKYEEWVYTNSTWTKIGDTSVDMSAYATTEAMTAALAKKQDKLSDQQLSDIADIQNKADASATESAIAAKQDKLTQTQLDNIAAVPGKQDALTIGTVEVDDE